MWLSLFLYDFCRFRSVAVHSMYKLQFFTFISDINFNEMIQNCPSYSTWMYKMSETVSWSIAQTCYVAIVIAVLSRRNKNAWSFGSLCLANKSNVICKVPYRNFDRVNTRWTGKELGTGVNDHGAVVDTGCDLGLDVSVSRRSRDAPTSRLGLVST